MASLGTGVNDVVAGVLIDAPTIFGAWIVGSLPNSFCVVDITSKDVAYPPGPKPDWMGTYGPAPDPAGTGNGLITILNGEATININMGSSPSNGAFACNLAVTGMHGCVSQSIQCSGTAFIPNFVK